MNRELYIRCKQELLKIKKLIDENIKKNGISDNLPNYENKLDIPYKTILKLGLNFQDKRYITFNYYGSKSYIYIAKGWKLKAIDAFLTAFSNFVAYLKEIKDISRWGSAAGYYKSLSYYILDTDIELFGNTPDVRFEKIIMGLDKIIQYICNLQQGGVRIDVERIISNFIFSLARKSKGVYTEDHLRRTERIDDLISFVLDKTLDRFVKGNLMATKFILLRKKLHYILRELIPTRRSKNISLNNIEDQIKEVIREMEKVANLEYKFFTNLDDNIGKKPFMVLCSQIDKLTWRYYNFLWVKKDLIKTFKVLEEIFSVIRRNIKIISTPEIFSHFTQEYLFLTNYFKILLLKRDFEKFSDIIADKDWQRELASNVSYELGRIASNYFKYERSKSLERELIIVEKATSGKFLEFVIFYLLRELADKGTNLNGRIKNTNSIVMKNISSLLSIVKNKEEIEWDYRVRNQKGEIDILISKQYGLILKSGILNTDDRKRIFNDIELSKQLNLRKLFIVIDIAKNLEVIKKLNIQDQDTQNIVVLDIRDFLETLLEVSYEEIPFKLGKSSVLGYAGFYSSY